MEGCSWEDQCSLPMKCVYPAIQDNSITLDTGATAVFPNHKAGKEPGHFRRLTIHLIHNINVIQIAKSRLISSQALTTLYLQEIPLSAKKSNTRLVTVFLSVRGVVLPPSPLHSQKVTHFTFFHCPSQSPHTRGGDKLTHWHLLNSSSRPDMVLGTGLDG